MEWNEGDLRNTLPEIVSSSVDLRSYRMFAGLYLHLNCIYKIVPMLCNMKIVHAVDYKQLPSPLLSELLLKEDMH